MFNKHLRLIANLSVHHTRKMVLGIIILTLILGYQASSLQLQLGLDYLLPNNNPRIQTFNQILDTFENESNIMLIAAGSEDSLRSFAHRIKPILESFDEWISGVHTHTPIEFLRANALKLMTLDELDNFGDIFYDPNLIPFLFNLNNAFENTYLHSNNRIISKRDEQYVVDFLDRIQLFIRAQEEIMLETEAMDVGQMAVDAIIFGESLKLSADREMLLIIIEPKFNMHLPAEKLLRNVNGIEEIVKQTADQQGISARLTGPLIKTRDHYTAFLSGFWNLSILSLVSFSLLLILFFRMWSIPILCISNLIVCILWTLGIYSFFMEAINLISILSLVIFLLVGLGNFILIISGFIDKRKKGLNIEVSMQETLQHFGSSLIVSGCVIVVVFLAMIFSEIKIFQDLGILAGIGITTTMMVTIIVLPSMLLLLEKLHKYPNSLHSSEDTSYSVLGKGAQWLVKYRWIAIIFLFFLTGLIFYQDMKMYMDLNLSKLESHDSDSINIENELIKSFGISSNLISFITDNLETARMVTIQSREIMSAGLVESISDYLPDKELNDEIFRYLKELRRKIQSREVRKQLSSHDIKMYRKEIERLEANIIELQDFSLLKDHFNIYEKTKQLVGDGIDSSFQGILPPFINRLDMGLNRLQLTYFQEQFSSAFKSTILEMANTEPLTLHNLPLEMKSRFTGNNDNIFRINIYPKQNIWDYPTFLDLFVNESSSINEKITGWPVLFVELKERMSYYGFQSIRLILISMLLLLLIDLRSMKNSLIIMASITVGLIWLMGALVLFNSSLSLMNIWIIPIIISIGMNNTILVLQCWKQEMNLDIVYRSTGKAILLTTMTIFAMILPFWFTNHTGLSSIVSALMIGLVCNLFAHLIIIPPLLGADLPS